MSQPVRKVIKDLHPEIDEKPTYTLLIDGNNMLRRSMVEQKLNSKGEDYAGVLNTLVQIKIMLKKKMFDYIYFVADYEDSGIMRYEVYSGYKQNRNKAYADSRYKSDYGKEFAENLKRMQKAIFGKNRPVREETDSERIIRENFERERDVLFKCFNELYIRWIADDKTEGDDLIAYYVKNKRPNDKVVIWSTDEDYTQLISDTVIIYNQKDKGFLTEKNFKQMRGYLHENVLTKKILCGDQSDNIKNISGLSEARLFEMMPEIREKPVTVEDVIERAKELCEKRISENKKPLKWQENIVNGVCNGEYEGDFYETNRFLVDLSHPLLTEDAKNEMDNMMYNAQDPEGRSFENLSEIIREAEITDLIDSNHFSSFFSEFKTFADNEIKRFKEMSKE